jgi:hypothetical protein
MPTLANVRKLLESGDYILFLGAGVGVEAGLGTWPKSLNEIADLLPASASYMSDAIKKEVAKNRFLEAAELFYLTDMIEGERHEILRKVFDKPLKLSDRLRTLINANYQAIITTNYDKSLIAVATDERIQLTQYVNSPEDLSAASVPIDRFILRLHGRIEVPTSLVLAKRHYEKLKQDQYYKRVIDRMLEHHNFVFFGFSFADPHLYELIKTFSEITNGYVRRNAYALFSDQPSSELKAILNSANIKSVVYDPTDSHRAVWELFSSLATRKVVDINAHEEDVLRRRLAAMLTHLRLRRDVSAQDQIIESIILSTVREKPRGVQKFDLVKEACRAYQRIANRETHVERVVDRLITDGVLVNSLKNIITVVSDAGPTDNVLAAIVKGVMDVGKVRYGIDPKNKVATEKILATFIIQVLAEDGMLVAHSLTSRNVLKTERIDKVIEKCLVRLEATSKLIVEPFVRSILMMIERPEPSYQKMLDFVASVTFAISTVTSDPNVISNAHAIGNGSIYLDASIAIPWLAFGHPSAGAYDRIVTGMSSIPSIVPDFYINEIVSHRNLAIEESKGINLDNPDVLKRYLTFHGSHSVNAYIAGFAGTTRSGYGKSFKEYLDEHVPFSSDSEATTFLRGKGLIVQPLKLALPGESANIPYIKSMLKEELEKLNSYRNDVRIEHDAKMVIALQVMEKTKQDKHSFVTADRKLIGAVSNLNFGAIAEKMLMPHQAITLSQINKDSIETINGLSRIIWNVRHDDVSKIEEFYRDRVLQEYEPALLERMDTIVTSIVDEVAKLAKFGLDDDDHDFQDRVQEFKALEQFEDRFHEKMEAERQRLQQLHKA